MVDYLSKTLIDMLKPPVLPEGVQPQEKWKLVKYRSVYYETPRYGYLTPAGDVVIWIDWVIPSKWLTAASKQEVAEIIEYV